MGVFLDANELIGTIGASLGDCFLGNILVIFSKKSLIFFKLKKIMCIILLRFVLKIF